MAIHAVFNTPKDKLIWDVGPPVLSAQDPDRAARPHPHAARRRRALGLHPAGGERLRPVRGGAFLDLDLGGARLRGGARPRRAGRRRRGLRDRRRGDVGGHGLRGDEQRRAHEGAAVRHPERQRDVDRAAGRGDVEVPVAALRRRAVPGPAGRGQGRGAGCCRSRSRRARGGRASWSRGWRSAARSSRSSASPTSGRSTGTTWSSSSPILRAVKARADGPVLIHALTRKGKGYRAGGGLGRQVPRGREVRRGDRRAAEEAVERAVLHQGLRAVADPRGGGGRADRRGDGGDAGRHRARTSSPSASRSAASTSASPSSTR